MSAQDTLKLHIANKSKVVHKQRYRSGVFGGLVNTTLCGRLHGGNEHNASSVDAEVTCKFCRAALAKADGDAVGGKSGGAA